MFHNIFEDIYAKISQLAPVKQTGQQGSETEWKKAVGLFQADPII